jgi:2-iminobutanoate/2-iminopropanoate deaminase
MPKKRPARKLAAKKTKQTAATRTRKPPAKRTNARAVAWPTVDIDPGWPWDDKLPYVQGRRVGPFIFTAGQSAIADDGTVVGVGDMKAQTLKAFENIRTVLRKAGADLKDVIKITTYVTDDRLFGEMLEARAEVFGGHPPASTGVIVKALAMPDLMVEIEAIAYKP